VFKKRAFIVSSIVHFFVFIFSASAIFKHQGYDVKELPDEQDDEPSIDFSGTIKVTSCSKSSCFFVVLLSYFPLLVLTG
jgi:NADH:ubiquinone oxidoreductase subunit H